MQHPNLPSTEAKVGGCGRNSSSVADRNSGSIGWRVEMSSGHGMSLGMYRGG